MIQINPLKSYIDGGVRAALTTPPSASLVFDLPGKAIWVKGVKLKGTDHTYTFSHDNYITLTNTPDSNESEDIKIGVNTSALKNAIDTTYGVVSTTANGLAPKFISGNKLAASAATTYYFLGWTGTTLKWYQAPFRNIRINSETTDCLGVNNTDPLIISSGNGISVTWDSTNKKIIITNTKPDVNHNTDRTGIKLATVSGTKKTDSTLILANSTSGLNIQGGTNKFLIGDGTNYIEVPVTPSFTISNKDATIGTALTTIATIAGVDIKAKIASYSLSNHTHSVKINGSTKTITTSGAVDLGNYLPLSGGTMTGSIYIPGLSATIIHTTRSESNWIYISELFTGSSKSETNYQAGIGWHNTGGNGNGALTLVPYAQNSDPWLGNVGLYIAQNSLKFNGTAVSLSGHTHAWNSLTHSSTTENQAILTNGSANGWKLYTLNISGWNNAANNAHSHSNKSILDGITSTLVSNWNTAYNFVNTITGTDTDKIINKWDEIVNFLAGISEDNKLNTLLNSKLSVYELANNTNVGAIKNNGIYYSTSDTSSGTLINSPFNTVFTLINMTSYDGGDDLRRSRLAFNAYGEIKVSNDRDLANTAETWYQVLTSHNTYISNGSGIINGTIITLVSNADTTDGVHLEWSGQLTYDLYSWLAAWTNDGKKIKAVNKSLFATSGHTHSYLPLSGGTMIGAINLTNTNAKIAFGSLATSPITGYKAPSLSTNGVGIYSRYGGSSDEGAIIITEDTCVIYNSADTGWNFQVMDKDIDTDMTNDATRSFGVNQNHQAWSLAGFVKSGSSDSYVLLGGGGHKAISDFATSGHNHNNSYVASVSISGNNLRINKNGINTDLTIPYAINTDKVDGYHEYDFSHSWRANAYLYTKFITITRSSEKGFIRLHCAVEDNSGIKGADYIVHWLYDATNENKLITINCLSSYGSNADTSVYAVRKSGTLFDLIFKALSSGAFYVGFSVISYSSSCTINNYDIAGYTEETKPQATYTSSAMSLITDITGNASTATVANKLGTSTIGATNIPIYLNSGTPTVVNLNSTANNLINNLSVGDSVPTDNDYYISQYVNGGTTTTTYHRRPHSALYAYIKGKAEGTWNISINGNAKGLSNNGDLNSQEEIDNFLTANTLKYAKFRNSNFGFADNDGMILSIPWSSANYGFQMAFDDTTSGTVKVRGKNNSWGNWYTLLHSGNSNVSGGGSTWGSSITVNINGTSKTLTIPGNPNTDYRVTQSETTTANYRPLVVGYTNVSTAGSGMTGSVTNQVYLSNKFYVQPSTGNLYATNFVGALSGNASTATKLQTARNLWGNSFNGTTDINGTIRFNNVTSGLCEGILWTCGDNDFARIKAGATGSNAGYLEIATADDGNEPIYIRQYSGVFNSVVRTLTLLDANGYTHFPSYINIGGNENNNYSPDRVWGSNGSDSYLRSYRTSALRVAYASSAGVSSLLESHDERGNQYLPYEVPRGIRLRFQNSGNNGLNSGGYYGLLSWRSYGVGDDLSGGYPFQIAYLQSGDLCTRVGIGKEDWSSWRILACLDSTVASATKLQTSRLLWGQSFDGTSNVSGSISGTYFHIEDRASNPYFLFIDSSNQISYLQLLPQNKGIAIGSTELKSLIVNPSGNVGIGTTSPGYKLHVVGVGNDCQPVLLINATRNGRWSYAAAFMAPNTGTGNNVYVPIGKAMSTRNCFGFTHEHAGGDGSAANYGAVEVFGVGNVLRWYYDKHTQFFGRVDVANSGNSSYNYDSSSMQVREYNYGGSLEDTWGNAPRLGWHWSGRVAAQIGLASNGWLYEAPLTATNFYRLVCETTSVTWGINITGNAATATNADKVDGYHASDLVKFYLSPMTNDAPADSAKSWFTNTMPSASGAIVYNVPGSEKTIIAGKSSGAYGHMLQLNYDNTYLRILRYYNGSWKSTDWEKISAGYADLAGSVAWNNVTGKPSSYTPSAHTHSWTSITDKLVAGNEFNIVNAGFNAEIWFNYVPINDRSKTATITGYHFGNGATGYTSIKASGFIKNGSSSSYVLLGDGGHKAESSLSVSYATSAGNADTLDGYHANTFATAGHTHSYLPLSGGTMTGTAWISWPDSGNWSNSNSGVTFPVTRGGLQWSGQSDYIKLFSLETSSDNLNLVLQFGDDNSNGLSIRNNNDSQTIFIAATGYITATQFNGFLNGNASTATALSSIIANDKLPERLREVTTSYSGRDANTIPSNGFYYCTSNINGLSDANILQLAHTNSSWRHQLMFKFGGTVGTGTGYDGKDLWTRLYNGSSKTWTEWYRILTSGNFNAYAPTKTGGGASGTWGINITGNATTSTKSEYSRSLLGRSTSGSDYSTNNENLVFAEWNTMNDSRWYLKATSYECRVAFASSAGNADTTDGVHITWAGLLTSTNHLVAWEADGSALRDINPANISVGYASSAGNADTVDGYHATTGRTFNGNINWSNNWDDTWSDGTNSHPWYGFDHRYPNTGAYSTTISDYFGMTIKTSNTLRLDFGTLLLNGTNIYNINVASATKWATARTLTIGNTGKTVDGSGNVSWTLAEIGAATSGHTHTLSLASDTGTSSITLAHGGKYKLTAGGNSVIFTLPTDNNTNPTNYYWANIKVSATSNVGTTPQFNKVKINTTSSTYQLNVSGDSYVTNWCRAGKGLYLESSNIYFAYSDKSNTTAEIDLLSNNEFCWGANSDTLYFNYKLASRNATTVTKYVWNAGSSSTYATHTTGNIILGNVLYQLKRGGYSASWYRGRDTAIIRQTDLYGITTNTCYAIISSKTYYGSWEISTYLENLYFSYVTDTAFNNASPSYIPSLVRIDSDACVYATHFYESSDIRYKKILRNLSINSNTIATLPLFDFEWIENNVIGTGTSALAVLLILPNLVSGTDRLTLDYGVLGTIAGITACKELVTLKSELLQLKEKVKELEDKLRKYENI